MTQTSSFQCARCDRIHNDECPPPGWSKKKRHGLICDDCTEQVELGRKLGREARGAA